MKRALFLASILCLIVSVGFISCKSGTTGNPSAQQKQISQLKSRVSKLESQLQEQRESYASLSKEHTKTLRELHNLEKKYKSLKKDYKELLKKEFTPSPEHALSPSEIRKDPEFKSTGWRDAYRLQTTVERIAQRYLSTHTYMKGEFDCDDMAVDLWNILRTKGIKSVIAIGNLEKSGESLSEANHAWLYVFNADGKVFYLEPTTGKVIYGRLASGSTNPDAIPYREAFLYKSPSDLWKDLGRIRP